MRIVRNVAFVVFMSLVVFAGVAPLQAEDCPNGCSCTYVPGGPCAMPYFSVSCSQVYECGETYPGFCSGHAGECAAWCFAQNSQIMFDSCSDTGPCEKSCQCWPLACG